MKSLFKSCVTLLMVFAAVITISCDNPNGGSGSNPVSLQELLQTSNDNIDLSTSDFTLASNSILNVGKAITITGGNSQYDLKGAKIYITATGTIINNVKNVTEIIVEEDVGTGDFTLNNSAVEKITVRGGGSNSIHVKDCTVTTVNVEKKNVRIVMEGRTSISKVNVNKQCILDSKDVNSVISEVNVDDSVQTVTIEGKTKIKKLTAVDGVTVNTSSEASIDNMQAPDDNNNSDNDNNDDSGNGDNNSGDTPGQPGNVDYITWDKIDYNNYYDMIVYFYDDNTLKYVPELRGESFSGKVEAIDSNLEGVFKVGSDISFDHAIIEPHGTDSWEWEMDIHDQYDGILYWDSDITDLPIDIAREKWELMNGNSSYIKIDGKYYSLTFRNYVLSSDYFSADYMMNDGTDTIFRTEKEKTEHKLQKTARLPITHTDPYRKGYVFDGWYTEPECINCIDELEEESDQWGKTYNVYFQTRETAPRNKYYAKWTENTSGYEIGDIILSDGTKVTAEDFSSLTPQQKDSVVAVIGFITKDGKKAYGIATEYSDTGIDADRNNWCAKTMPGYLDFDASILMHINHVGKEFDPEDYNAGTIGYSEIVLIDNIKTGESAWDKICSVDTVYTDPDIIDKTYPAFYYALNYGKIQNFPEQYQDNWYLGHTMEYYQIQKNYSKVNDALVAIGKENNYLEKVKFWTCVSYPDPTGPHWAYVCNFENYNLYPWYGPSSGFGGKCNTTLFGSSVLPIREFN